MNNLERLPLKCDAFYQSDFLSKDESDFIYDRIVGLGIEKFTIVPTARFGKMIFTDQSTLDAGSIQDAMFCESAEWFPELKKIGQKLSSLLNWSFGCCVAIFYPDGEEGVDFHFDPPSFGDTSVIASLSLGAERTFQLRDKQTEEVFSKVLENGSLIVMGKGCQELYEHALPLDTSCTSPRLNLTFRHVGALGSRAQ